LRFEISIVAQHQNVSDNSKKNNEDVWELLSFQLQEIDEAIKEEHLWIQKTIGNCKG
jgi:hypothetical protein